MLAEIDYLLATRVSTRVERAFLGEVSVGAYRLEVFDGGDVAEALEVLDRHADLGLGLADASIVVLARRHRVLDVLTLDQRHFRAVQGFDDQPFRILPSDAPARRGRS